MKDNNSNRADKEDNECPPQIYFKREYSVKEELE